MKLPIPILVPALALAIALQVPLLITVMWFLLGIAVLTRIWNRQVARSLRVTRSFSDRAFCGDTLEVDATIRNDGRLPAPWLEVSESIPLALQSSPVLPSVMSLAPRSEAHLVYRLSCRQRGLYEIGPLHLRAGDTLGLDSSMLRALEPRRLIVYPRIVPLDRLGLPTQSALVVLPARTPLFEDASRVIGVRDYAPGDSPRRIHWGATARTSHLVVKQYQYAIARESLLFVDLDPRDYERAPFDSIETAIVTAASLADHMLMREGLAVGLVAHGKDDLDGQTRRIVIPARAERSHLITILETLARVQASHEVPFNELLHAESRALGWGTTLVLITGGLDDALSATIVQLKRAGHAVAVILVQPPDPLQTAMGNHLLGGVPLYRVWADADLAALA